MPKTTIFHHPYTGRVEHPRGLFWDRQSDNSVKVTKITLSGQVLFTTEITQADWVYIADAMVMGKYVAPPEPEPEPEPEPTPDPAPRATDGTPEAAPVNPDAPKAKADARRRQPSRTVHATRDTPK